MELLDGQLVQWSRSCKDTLSRARLRNCIEATPAYDGQRYPSSRGQALDLVELSRGLESIGDQHLLYPPGPGSQELSHRATPFDLLPSDRPAASRRAGCASSTFPTRCRTFSGSSVGRGGPRASVELGATGTAGLGPAHDGGGTATSATAKQAIPSARPSAPRDSARFAFTLTGAPTAPDRRLPISAV